MIPEQIRKAYYEILTNICNVDEVLVYNQQFDHKTFTPGKSVVFISYINDTFNISKAEITDANEEQQSEFIISTFQLDIYTKQSTDSVNIANRVRMGLKTQNAKQIFNKNGIVHPVRPLSFISQPSIEGFENVDRIVLQYAVHYVLAEKFDYNFYDTLQDLETEVFK